ncbi:hypothetical protein M094_2556 [Bacteroides uniformis str. 3978 T3 ii]|uniref:Uncharacterized protein n=1 Tax=Bacteroides uniformis str. 3978 T3 ii TaxID=1339349 RepID=A0A078RWM7_BACUN|nr:hypothetical protein M094_2556 [Bacteroides uniformis str. 3978 T3 ii]
MYYIINLHHIHYMLNDLFLLPMLINWSFCESTSISSKVN